MRILLVHNLYRSAIPSGENAVFHAERELLREAGHEVEVFTRSNDEVGAHSLKAASAALTMAWNARSAASLKARLAELKPDCVHVHNTFPLITPAAFWAAHQHAPAVVMTLHNNRLYCAAGIGMREGQPCTQCLTSRSVLPGIRYACYRGSRAATLPVSAHIAFHHAIGTWQHKVDAFIALTEFQRSQLIEAGLPQQRIHVKPNFTQPPKRVVPWRERENKVVFVGRVAPEKGCDLLVEAWRAWGGDAPRIEVIGDGQMLPELRRQLGQAGWADNVTLLGNLPSEAVQERVATAKLLVLPSRWLESLSMSIVEAFSHGVPVVASRLGTLQSIVHEGDNGRLFTCGDASDLLSVVRALWADDAALASMSERALDHYQRYYSPAVTYRRLIEIYGAARDEHAAANTSS